MITNAESGTNAERDRRRHLPDQHAPEVVPGGFSFNQYLVVDEEPLLFHTGPRRMFPLVARGDRPGAPDRATALDRVLPLRGRRMRRAQCAAGRRAAGRSGLQPGRRDGLRRRLRGPRAAGARRRRDASARKPRGPLVRRAPRSARLGDRPPDGNAHPNALLRRPVHAGGHRRNAADGVRHPRAERGVPQGRWTTTRTRKTPARSWSASRPTEPTTLACMHGSAWRGDGKKLSAGARGRSRGLSGRSLSATKSGCRASRSGLPSCRAGSRPRARRAPRADKSDRDGTVKAPGGQPPVDDRSDGDDAAAGRLDRGRRLPRGLARREDVLDDDDRLARLERESAPQRESAVLALDEHRRHAERPRRLVADDDAPERRRNDRARPELRQLRRELPPRLLRPLRPHQQPRALQIPVGVQAPTKAGSAR